MLEVVHIDEPFKLSSEDFPLKKIYVLDDWLCTELHHAFDSFITQASIWSKTNQVGSKSSTGLPQHSFWGASFFRDDYKIEDDIIPSHTYFPKYLDRRLQTEFGFKWVRFQYMGLNSQTQGLEGTTHQDCHVDDEWNLSFLYYTNRFWSPKWGGILRMYDEEQSGILGREEHIKNHQIAEIEFKPNRLILMDGRIPHGADAPSPSARYVDRRSIVIRGDEVRLPDPKEYFYATDKDNKHSLNLAYNRYLCQR